MSKKVSLWIVIVLMSATAISSATLLWALTSLKVIHGTAVVDYRGDITIQDFKFISDTEVLVTISSSLSSKPQCTISVSGAGIFGSKSISSGWSSPLTTTLTISGALSEGTITIEVTS